jgi:hypothetical protein
VTEWLCEVRLPADLCRAAEKEFGEHFATLEDLLSFILRTLLNEEAAEMDQAEVRILEERLRNLGYLDATG